MKTAHTQAQWLLFPSPRLGDPASIPVSKGIINNLAVDAGLGEIGRLGYLIAPGCGPRF